ncbi:enoyl-CoA hydratase/isomerase family protein [Geomonas sp. RF6]|uniref:enoyl-CoA hydratase/isomerase family protein n=1 Tax=Geomonas sp. RF6 TaxID=2897342 RepID=UPI001E3FE4A9|nr:enoyl-CoA hydratase/isomerase family protein [Geomonas sp. RF6]UFS69453.1 enoyl-CoA hydratase/isomerase family protein [Geomonas sp. RF6]
MSYTKLSITTANGVGYLMLDSGGRFNTLSIGTLREISAAFKELSADPAATVIVISGFPGESFAVGANIAEMLEFSPGDALAFADVGQALFEMMEDADKPVIAALNGITMGGGCDLSLACDLRLASDSLRVAHPGARLGILTGFCGTQKLPRLIGRGRALEVFMTAATYNAADALAMGYVSRVFPQETFWQEVTAFAEALAQRPVELLATAKTLVNCAEDVELKSGCALERASYVARKKGSSGDSGGTQVNPPRPLTGGEQGGGDAAICCNGGTFPPTLSLPRKGGGDVSAASSPKTASILTKGATATKGTIS